jgi:ribosome maturation factor RimP
MISKAKIESLIAEKLASGEYFVVSLDISPSNKIKLVVDCMNKGITIDECVQFSRAIEHNLDREEEDFALEVTSPGLDLPLKVKEQYVKNIGRDLSILTRESKQLKGTLKLVDKDFILLEEEKKMKVEGSNKKIVTKIEQKVDFSNINKALVILKF